MQQPFKLQKKGPTSAVKDNMGRDVISELPDDLIYLIIKHLSLRDAVKASVLFGRWKGVCFYLKDLHFDWVNMFLDAGNSDFYGICESPCREYRDKFVGAVNQFLNFYHGKKLRKFKVTFCLGCDFTDVIDRWIGFVVRMGAENLSVRLYCDKYCCKRSDDEFGGQSEGKYVLRSELFEGRRTYLKQLVLIRCILGPNFAKHFSFLGCLRLDHVPLFSYDMGSMFTGLINLRYLILNRCSLPKKLYFGLLPLLKYLGVSACNGMERIEFSNANLLDFLCFCHHEVMCDLSGVPNLRDFRIGASARQVQYVFTHMPEHTPKLESLDVRSHSNWAIDIPQSITIFREVTSLNLIFYRNGKFDNLKMISILRSFPTLRKFMLTTCCLEDVDRGKLDHGGCAHEHLKEVEIDGFYNTPNQIEFAIYLLKRAISLNQLVIRPVGRSLSKSRQSWYEGERENVYEQLREFSKNSVLTIL